MTPPASADILEAAEKLKARGDSAPRRAPDPVNLPMIRHWVEAIGDDNPRYTDPDTGVAPPAMIQVWTMRGLRGERAADDPLGVMTAVLDEAGYTSVVATNCEQAYHRELRAGERLSVTSRLEEVVGPKRTALGDGWFVTTRSTWYVAGEPVGEMLFRVLKYRPSPKPAGEVLRPAVNRDTAYFWEGTAAGELRIQRCDGCGLLRHPPGPMCPRCGQPIRGYAVAAGVGEVFSYVVHHHPPMPGRPVPYVVALVELPEGVRVLAELVGADPSTVHIGMPVEIAYHRVDPTLTLPVWRPRSRPVPPQSAAPRPAPPRPALPLGVSNGSANTPKRDGDPTIWDPKWKGEVLPEVRIDVTPTFVVAGAVATRDFQDVHHDRDAAVARGSEDIFLNILTTTGLVQRYVTEWAGPDAVIREIALRLGAPCYAYDTLVFNGRAQGETVSVTGSCRLGDHVTATVRIQR